MSRLRVICRANITTRRPFQQACLFIATLTPKICTRGRDDEDEKHQAIARRRKQAATISFSLSSFSCDKPLFFQEHFSFYTHLNPAPPPLLDTMACVDESDFSMMHDEEDDDFDLSDAENMGPVVTKKGASSKGLSVASSNVPPAKKSGKTIETQYRKLTQREHCLVRPDTYIGSIEPITDTMFVLDEATDRIVSREVTYTPGLYKIFDESKSTPLLHFALHLV